jgi:hypothetical protein
VVQPGSGADHANRPQGEKGRPAGCSTQPTGQPPKHVAESAANLRANLRPPLPFPFQPLKHETATAKVKIPSPFLGEFLKKAVSPILDRRCTNKAKTVFVGSDVSRSPFAFRFHFSLANERTERPQEQMNLTRTTQMQPHRNVPSRVRVESRGMNVSAQAPPQRRQVLDSRAARHSQRPTVG